MKTYTFKAGQATKFTLIENADLELEDSDIDKLADILLEGEKEEPIVEIGDKSAAIKAETIPEGFDRNKPATRELMQKYVEIIKYFAKNYGIMRKDAIIIEKTSTSIKFKVKIEKADKESLRELSSSLDFLKYDMTIKQEESTFPYYIFVITIYSSRLELFTTIISKIGNEMDKNPKKIRLCELCEMDESGRLNVFLFSPDPGKWIVWNIKLTTPFKMASIRGKREVHIQCGDYKIEKEPII